MNPLIHWPKTLEGFVPGFMRGHEALRQFTDRSAVLLHGSTTFGIDDPWSDIDLWIIAPSDAVADHDRRWPTRFIEFQLNGKVGHFTIEPVEGITRRIARCDFPLIAELRHAMVLADSETLGNSLVTSARQPMSDAVARAWFRYHYIEFRGDHRALDNPIERGHQIAMFIAASKAIEHALRAACILDREPYHYSKWLATMARRTPTGAAVTKCCDELLDLLAQGALRLPGPEKQHPLSMKLREIRAILIDAARASEIDAPWLKNWWLYIDKARGGIHDVAW